MKTAPDNVKAIGSRLRNLRKASGFSMRELAAKADVAASFVSRIEAGKASPTIMTLQKLLEALGIEVVEFFQQRDVRDPAQQVIFTRSEMQALDEVDRNWRFLFPSHPEIGVVMSYEEYQPNTDLLEIERHPRDTYGYVVSGELCIEIPGRGTFTAKRGDAFFLKANTDHTSRNAGTSTLKLVVAQTK